MPIILFDIDGTLIRTGGAGKIAMESALTEEFGVPLSERQVSYSGRTDPAIGRELLRTHGIDPTPTNVARLHEAYLARLPVCLTTYPGTICAGIIELIAMLKPREDVLLGLLTGNIRRGAQIKLSHYSLWDHFVCGGFGDDHHDRDDVARTALRTVRDRRRADVDPADVWVIGDTPLDVQCARAIGAKAVAVATGWHAIEELEAAKPDFAFADLSEPTVLMNQWK